jgi:hypothetical protein
MESPISTNSKAPLGGVMLLFGAAILAGVVIGGIASLVGRFLYLIIMFPIIMGAIVGWALNKAIVIGKIRSTFIAIAAGVLAAVVTYGSMHIADYIQFRIDAANEIQKQVVAQYGQRAPDANVQAYIDELLIQETGAPGFIGYILFAAKQGVSISHVGVGSSDSGINLGPLTWLYWLAELGLIGWMTISTYKTAQQPFCEHCDTWLPAPVHVGGMTIEVFKNAVNLIKTSDYANFAAMLTKGTRLPSMEFYTRSCKTCNIGPFYFTGYVVSQGKKGQTVSKLVVAQELQPSQRFALTNALNTTSSSESIRPAY